MVVLEVPIVLVAAVALLELELVARQAVLDRMVVVVEEVLKA